MSFWQGLAVIAVIYSLAVTLIVIFAGRLFMLNRLYLEEVGVDRAVRAIRKFLNRPQDGGVQFYIRQRDQYDEIIPEEEAGAPEICVVCQECGLAAWEDARPPLAVISGRYIPLCRGHKKFVLEFERLVEKLVEVEESVDETPFE